MKSALSSGVKGVQAQTKWQEVGGTPQDAPQSSNPDLVVTLPRVKEKIANIPEIPTATLLRFPTSERERPRG